MVRKTLGAIAAVAACVGSLSTPAAAMSDSLVTAVDAYLKPIAMDVAQRVKACQDGTVGADGECSTTLKVLTGNGASSFQQSLSLNKVSGLPAKMVGKFSETYLREGWDESVKESFIKDLSKAAKKGKTTFQKAFTCDDVGNCKYVIIMVGKGEQKGHFDVFAMQSSRQFQASPNVAIVRQTTTDPETGLPSGNKIVFQEMPRDGATNPEDVLAYFDKLVYEKMKSEVEKASQPSPFGIPGMFDEAAPEEEADSERDLFKEREHKRIMRRSKRLRRRQKRLRKKITRVVHRLYKKCIVECTKESLPGSEDLGGWKNINSALIRAGTSCSKTCEEESRELIEEVQNTANSLFQTLNKMANMKRMRKRKLRRRALESLANPSVGGGKWKYDDVGAGATARLAALRRLHGR